jgi:hypothetical protein
MTSFTKRLKYPVILTALLGLAACQSPLSQPEGFKFELVGAPVSTNEGTALAVRLVRSDETAVPSAQLYVMRWIGSGSKGDPRHTKLVALNPNGDGAFTYTSKLLTAGDHLSLAARLTSDGSLIHGTIEVH